MGRGKIAITRIENSNNRQVTYSKRRNGILKKAKEITVLCDAQLSLVIFSSSGKMNDFCSPNTTVADILDRYHKQSGKRLWDARHEIFSGCSLNNEIDRVKKDNDNMQIELRHLKGEDIQSLQYRELMRLEQALENGLSTIRDRQMELWKAYKKNSQMLEDENSQLSYMLQQKMTMEGNMRGMENGGYPSDARDYHSQIPFAPFRIQPMQPNLQERM